VLCAKGIERDTGKLMSEVLAETVPQAAPGVLSGPSFAIDVARGLPTAVTLACEDAALGEALAGNSAWLRNRSPPSAGRVGRCPHSFRSRMTP